MPAPIRLPFVLLLFTLNTLVHAPLLLALALFKLLLPVAAVQRRLSAALVGIAESWIGVNSSMIRRLTPVRFEVEGVDALQRHGWYLVLCNHRSWVDIPVLQSVFNRRVPMLKFFLKRELIWVPLLGLAWWALDFPFMRRYRKSQLARRPELRGRDAAATREACRRFSQLPVSVMNFVEGTRFTPAKHAHRQPPYRHLLQPKAGGTAIVLQAMGDLLHSVLDVTIAYPDGTPTLLDLLAGRIACVRIHVRERPIPGGLVGSQYDAEPAARASFQRWLNGLWEEKDARLGQMLAEPCKP